MKSKTRQARVSGTLDPVLACIPTNWLDPMLTGPQRVIGDPPYDCRDIERVLLAVRYRIEAHLKANTTHQARAGSPSPECAGSLEVSNG